jgi:hypothetical protein
LCQFQIMSWLSMLQVIDPFAVMVGGRVHNIGGSGPSYYIWSERIEINTL